MLKPERVTFSADDDKFRHFTTNEQLDPFLNDSLVHYSTDFKSSDQQELTNFHHSNSLDELSSITMSSQEQHQQQQTEHEPPVSAPPLLTSEQVPILNENNLHQFDALTLQRLAIGTNQHVSTNDNNNDTEDNTKTSPIHSASMTDIQKEIDRVKQMKYGRTYSSPTSSLCSRLTINPFNGSTNNNIDLSSVTHAVHFSEQSNPTNRLPFTSTYITSIPESIVPASGTPSTNDNHFIPIHQLESPSIEDREVFETLHTKQTSIPGMAIRQSNSSLNRNISTSETDLITSLHRSASKQGLDTQSEHGSGISDDMIFVEWDKERSLFQDYINSLRTEIRVLLQERLEYQKQMEIIENNLHEHKHFSLNEINNDENKVELLQKSLEEKNLVLEQLQKEYEILKEKNSNLTRKISNLRCDAKSQTGVIDELKQKIAELTVDMQNHILVKRRLDISLMNLESDCKIIDAERIRLNNDIKDLQFSKQDLEKLLQQANVQIAEQGSTIEMIRSDNIQIRSQLSATQRRMLQEKQQVMDYLRQIENDLVEKEQLKQRESILRKDYEKLQLINKQDRQEIEQLNVQINQDQQKLTQLEQERLQLLKTIQNMDDKQTQLETELNSYKSATKRFYTHFKIPFDSIQSIDQIIPIIEDRYRTEQISHAGIHEIPLVQSSPDVTTDQESEEVHRLREDLVAMNLQIKQLDEANQAWQQYQQNQLILLRDRLELTGLDNLSFEDIVQQIENRFSELNEQLKELQTMKKPNVDADGLTTQANELQDVPTQRTSESILQSKDTQTEDNEADISKEISTENISSDVTRYEEEIRHLQEDVTALTTQCAQLDEANRAWQLYHQTQLDSFKNKLQNSLPIEDSLSFDDIAQQILVHLDHMKNEYDNLTQQSETLEKLNHDLRSEVSNNSQTTQETYAHTIDELNQQLRLLKQQNDQLETEKYVLNQQLEKLSSSNVNQERNTPSPYSELIKQRTSPAQIHEAQIHSLAPVQSSPSPLTNEHEQELQQLRQNLTLLTQQYAQLDEANRAWQLYQQTQLHNFKQTLHDYIPIDDTSSFEQAAQQIAEQITKERQDFIQRYHTVEQLNQQQQSESANDIETMKQSYMDTIHQLNQQLTTIQQQYQQTNDTVLSSNVPPERLEEIPLSTSSGSNNEGVDPNEVEQLRQNLVSLTARLDETKRGWEEYQQTQANILRNQLDGCLSIDYNTSFDEIAEQIVDQITKERGGYNERYQALQKANNDLRSESNETLESIRQEYVNTVNELTQELLAMKEAYEQLDNEKQDLISELEKRPITTTQEQVEQPIEKVSSNIFQQAFGQVPIHDSSVNGEQNVAELQQLRENVTALAAQCAQLDEANRAWQQYHQTQLDSFKTKIHNYVPIDDDLTLDQAAQQITEQITKERENFTERYQALEKTKDDLQSESNDNLESIRQTFVNTVNELNQELLTLKEAYEQLAAEKQGLVTELEKRPADTEQNQARETIERVPSDMFKQPFNEVPIHTTSTNAEEHTEELRQLRETVDFLTNKCAQLEEANCAWQQYQQQQSVNFRTKLANYVSMDENLTLDQMAQQIVDQIVNEREDSNERFKAVEKINDDLRSESTNNLETIRQEYMNTVNELTQELLAMKEAYEQVDAEKQDLISELEKRPIATTLEQVEEPIEKVSSNLIQRTFEEVPIHNMGVNAEQNVNELEQLRENVASLTTQCAQLDEANRAWQLYQQTQLDNFRSKFVDILSIDESLTLDQAAQEIVDQILKEREEFHEKYTQSEKAKDDLQSESTSDLQTIKESYVNTIDQLSKELSSTKEQCEQLNAEKEVLTNLLEKYSTDSNEDALKLSHETSLQTAPSDAEQENDELRQLREDFATLTAQYAQINEANHAWQNFHQNQLENFRQKVQDHIPMDNDSSFDQIAKQIVDQITKEREDFTEQYQALEQTYHDIESESTNANLLEQQTEMAQLRTQLDEKTRSWQQFEHTQFDLLKNLLPFSNKTSLQDIIQDIILHINHLTNENQRLQQNEHLLQQQYEQLLEEKRIDNPTENNLDLLQKQLNGSHENEQLLNQQILALQNECQTLKQQLNNSLINQRDQQSSPFGYQDNFKQTRRTPIQDVPVHQITPVQSSSTDIELEEEIQQLRTNLASLTTQCAQLDEANHAWQQFHQNQLEIFRNNLHDWILLDENSTLEQIAQQILNHFEQLTNNKQNDNQLDSTSTIESLNNQLVNYQLNESILAQNLEELNQKLLNVHQECEEIRENNSQLILNNQQLEQQLDERQQLINNLQQQIDSLNLENYDLKTKSNDLEQQLRQSTVQRVDSPRENVPIHNIEQDDEIRQLRSDLAAASAHCLALEEANRAWQQYQNEQIDLFRQKLQEQILTMNQTENLSLDFIAQQIIDYLNQVNYQRNNLMQENSFLRDEIKIQKQQSERPGSADSSKRMFRRVSQDKNVREAQIHNVTPVRSSPSPLTNEHEQELQQLRQNLTLLTQQYAQLDEANRAWQLYQQTQLHNFKLTLHDYIPIDDSSSLEQAAQQIAEQITKERQDFIQQYHTLEQLNQQQQSESANDIETMKQSYMDTINQLNQQLTTIQQQYQQTNDTVLSSNVLPERLEEIPLSTGSGSNNEGVDPNEVEQLRQNLVSLTARLDETKRGWEEYQQTQANILRNQLDGCLSIDDNTSFDEIAEQIVDQITKEREGYNVKYQALEKANNDLRSESNETLESIRQEYVNTVNELTQELLVMKEAYEQVDAEKQDLISELEKRPITTTQEQVKQPIEKVQSNSVQQLFREAPTDSKHGDIEENVAELQQLRESVASLTVQCAELEAANHAWQQYQQTQLINFQNKLHDYVPVDDNVSFDQMAQQIVDYIIKEREDFSGRSAELEKANNDLRSVPNETLESIRQEYMNTVNELTQELLAMKEAYEQVDAEKQDLISELEKRPIESNSDQTAQAIEKVSSNILQQAFEQVSIHDSTADVDQNVAELQQLRENIAVLTAQCAQLDEANRGWQQYQQAQLDSFKTKLYDYVSVDDNISFDEIAQQIVDQITKEREDFTQRFTELENINENLRSESATTMQPIEQSSTENINELNEELVYLRSQYSELEKINQQLLTEKEDLNNQLNDRSIVVGHHSSSESNIVNEEIPAESKQESELQSLSSTPPESEELQQIRSDLALITSQFNELTETNEHELESFRNKLQNWLSLSSNSTLDEIAEQITNQFEEQQQQNPPETTENQTQTPEPPKKVHIAIETTPFTYEDHQTQIDPIDMIDQQIQTESFTQLFSNSDDENLLSLDEDDDRLGEYIDEISSLSAIDLSNRLNKECEQIISKQNLSKYLSSNFDLNHRALITIYTLYHQHLADDAKQLYNETVIRALRQEYELINNEKNDFVDKYSYELNETDKKLKQIQNQYDDLLEQNELERLHSKQSLDDCINKYEINLYNLHQENENLKYNLNNLQENYQQIQNNNYQQLFNEYQQLRQDYDELINQNELLKDFNSQIYQQKLQTNESNDIDIQCNLDEGIQPPSSNDDNQQQNLPIQEQGIDKSSYEEEINRLKAIISELQAEKEMNVANLQPVSIDENAIKTEQATSSEQENNDWSDQMSPIDIPSDEPIVSSTIKETVDNETQTDEQPQDKLIQVNNKLKRALQTVKDKIHQAITERPQLFGNISDDTIERLDHLISTIENQATQIEVLHNECDQLLERNKQLETAIIQQVSNENSTQTNFEQTEELTPINDNEQPSLTNRLLGFISNVTTSLQNSETQTDEQPQDKLVQVNNKLKRALQNMKDKIHQAIIDRPQLFFDISDDTIERLDHLISTIGNQAEQIENLQNERDQAQQEINQLQNTLEAYQYQIDNERKVQTEQLVSAAPESDDRSDHDNQIKQLQEKLSENEDERSLLRERLNEVELELRKTLDDHSSMLNKYEEQLQSATEERNTLIEEQTIQSAETQREIEQLHQQIAQLTQTSEITHVDTSSNGDIQSLQEIIQQQSEELRDLSEKYFTLSSQIESQDQFVQQKKDTEEQLQNCEYQLEHLTREHENLLEQVQNNRLSSIQTMDNESQTDDQQHEKLVQINAKLKRVLQSFKDKISRLVSERPELFTNVGEETSERLDHIISTVEHQAIQFDILQSERNEVEEQLRNEIQELQSSLEASQHQLNNERSIKPDQLVSISSVSENISDYEDQIKGLQEKLSQNEDERNLFRERLNEVELELRKTLDDHASTLSMYEEQLQSAIQERNALVEQQALQSVENQHEMEQLQQELDQLKQISSNQSVDQSTDEEIQSLKDILEQRTEELKDLNERYLILSNQFDTNVNLQSEFERQRSETEERLIDYENQIESLTRERDHLLEEVQKHSSSAAQTTEHDKQADDKLLKINNKLKRVLQSFKDKINRLVTERPELFTNVGEETNERLDHVISTVEHQATQLDILQSEHNEVEEQLRNEIRELERSVEAYRYQIENERPIKTESLVSAAPSSADISPTIIEDYEKQIKQLQQKLSQIEDERSLLRERLNEVELELRKTLDDHSSVLNKYEEQLQSTVEERNALNEQQAIQSKASQHEIEQLQDELIRLKQIEEQSRSFYETIEQQSEQLKYLNEKYAFVSSQLESYAGLDQQQKEIEERLIDYENQIESLTRERDHLLEEVQKHSSAAAQTTEHDKLLKINTKLKRVLQSFKDKINRLVTDRPELFANVGEETSERLDHVISTVEHLATQLAILQAERNELEEQSRNEINDLQNSLDLYRQQLDNQNRLKQFQKVENETTENIQEIQPLQSSNDNQWNDWSIDSSQVTDQKVQQSNDNQEPGVTNRLFGFLKNVTSPWSEPTATNDWDAQNSPIQLPSDEAQQTLFSSTSSENLIPIIKNKLQEIIFEYSDLLPNSNEDILNNIDQLVSLIRHLQNQIKQLQTNSSTVEEYQNQIERLIEERNQTNEENENCIAKIDALLQERQSLIEQVPIQSMKEDVQIQTDNDLLPSSEQSIPRRVFEHEFLTWTKEREQLKEYVKQIQIENKKLQDIISKFEPIVNDYRRENDRLKQENQHFSLLSDSLNSESSHSSDRDICYLTLKWLTYEVAQRTSDPNQQSLITTDDDDHQSYLQQRLTDTERQLKNIRLQNQRLKKQLETYTIQLKRVQHEMSSKVQEISSLKVEIDRLRTSETQYRLEVDRLKADLQCDQVKFQQLERQLIDSQFQHTNLDENSTNNLRELLELKERELNALKDKLEYTIQAHQLELQEAIKANQFSLDNVQRFEQLDQRHQEKRKELETRLGKICKIVRPLIDSQDLFTEESRINIDELQQLITDTEAEERVINSLGPIRNCLGLLESQMKELQQNLIENQARRSKESKSRLGLETLSTQNQWEVTSNMPNLQEMFQNRNLFLESLNTYSSSMTNDLIENDVRLCLDDILDEIVVRTIVK